MMRRDGLLIAILMGALFPSHILLTGSEAQETPASQGFNSNDSDTFDVERTIAPLLQARCLECHGRRQHEGGVRLDSREAILRGGDNHQIVIAGNADESRLFQLVTGTAPDHVVMPPEGPRLRPEQIEGLRRWINEGLPWPDSLRLDRSPAEIARSHWSFRPVVRPQVPVIDANPSQKLLADQDVAPGPIDGFVLARLESEGLTPAPLANRRTLIRRLTFDLIGLPPTPAEVDEFVADHSPDAVERLVDRLIASPHYGERWARPWLDLCHYGDTDGYLTDQKRPVAWRYRQWLIDALNSDLPLTDFTMQQIAGDLIPGATEQQLLGTGFLRNTLSNREGGADLEEYRVEQIVDRATMVGTAWLGLTVGCARCHDHKFDPLSQSEFYGLYAFFNNADEVNIAAPLPHEKDHYAREKPDYDKRRTELLAPQLAAILELQDRWEKKMLHAAANPGQDYLWFRQWEILGLVWGGELGEGQLEGCQIVLIPMASRTQDQRDRLLDYFLRWGELTDPARFKELKLPELQSQLLELAKQAPGATRAPVMQETVTPRQSYLHVRGDFRVAGDVVKPAIPEWLIVTNLTSQNSLAAVGSPESQPYQEANLVVADAPNFAATGELTSRLDLANWLASKDNPLTGRVFVNRAWQEFFGRGLVETADNFGLNGDRPSHPELLDWLADELHRMGGSLKRLHRRIATSRTYCQSSHVRPDLIVRDPQNRLLARQVPLRLSAEQVRDASLAVSGLLADQIGGPSVFPPQPESVSMEGFDQTWKASEGADRNRRGLYTWLQRLSPYAQGVTFDAPTNSRVCVRRERSNTPLQALTLLNDPIFWEAAESLAERITCEGPNDFDGRLTYGFQLVLGRSPDPFEQQRLTDHFHELTSLPREQVAAPHVSSASQDRSSLSAWTSIASILLNLHEFITRE
ncbi:PSD1 and planctomycete cytochrome C domain-containing protein [Schlesneria sp. T3-172]|uniref:PSD1 and planctomycete cytochrome C domain-containing protein n=1 Tax=Schlesneria sphaerica TaxID=3373610 RepID=UPI0037CACFBC